MLGHGWESGLTPARRPTQPARKARDTSGDGPQVDGNVETLDVAKNGDTVGKNVCARQSGLYGKASTLSLLG